VLFSSHLLDEIARVSDRVAMIAQGRLVLEGTLPWIIESHRRVVVRLPGEGVAGAALPGVLSIAGGPEEWTLICDGGIASLGESLRAMRGEVVEDSVATFEEIFHAWVSPLGNPTSATPDR